MTSSLVNRKGRTEKREIVEQCIRFSDLSEVVWWCCTEQALQVSSHAEASGAAAAAEAVVFHTEIHTYFMCKSWKKKVKS